MHKRRSGRQASEKLPKAHLIRRALALMTAVALMVTAMAVQAGVASASAPALIATGNSVSEPGVANGNPGLSPRSDSDLTAFFGHPRPAAPVTLHNVVIIPDKVVAQTVTVITAPPSGPVTGTAVLQAGRKTINTTWSWTDSCNWKVSLAGKAQSGKTPRNRTAINVSNVAGSISSSACERRFNLSLKGYRIGNRTVDIRLKPVLGGFEGQKTLKKLVLGQTTYSSVQVTVSTSHGYAELTGQLVTAAGKFTIDALVSAPKGKYQESLSVTGTNLKIEKGGVSFQDFHFSASSSIPKNGCATFSDTFGGSFKMKNNVYSLKQARITISCGKVTVLEFKIRMDHTDKSGVTTTGVLALALATTPGTAQDLTDPSLGDDDGHIGTIKYAKGLFGYVNLSKTRHFSKKYKNKTFSRDVTIGVVFGVAIYTTQAHPSGPVQAMIGAGGYFDADRVSGSFGCVYTHAASDDFTCAGKLRLNPSWAGVYHENWDGM